MAHRIINYKLCVDSFQTAQLLELVTKTIVLKSEYNGSINTVIKYIFQKENINSICQFDSARLIYIDENNPINLDNTNGSDNSNAIIFDFNESDDIDLDDIIGSDDLTVFDNASNTLNTSNTSNTTELDFDKFIISNNSPQYSLSDQNIKNQIKNCEIICVLDFNDFYDDNYTCFYKKTFANLDEFEQQYDDFINEVLYSINTTRPYMTRITSTYFKPHIVAVNSGLGWIKI